MFQTLSPCRKRTTCRTVAFRLVLHEGVSRPSSSATLARRRRWRSAPLNCAARNVLTNSQASAWPTTSRRGRSCSDRRPRRLGAPKRFRESGRPEPPPLCSRRPMPQHHFHSVVGEKQLSELPRADPACPTDSPSWLQRCCSTENKKSRRDRIPNGIHPRRLTR